MSETILVREALRLALAATAGLLPLGFGAVLDQASNISAGARLVECQAKPHSRLEHPATAPTA